MLFTCWANRTHINKKEDMYCLDGNIIEIDDLIVKKEKLEKDDEAAMTIIIGGVYLLHRVQRQSQL